MAAATVTLATRLATARGLSTVVLTGGVFQNARLSTLVEDGLHGRGLEVLVHRSVPPNDGGISIGQAAIGRGALGDVSEGAARPVRDRSHGGNDGIPTHWEMHPLPPLGDEAQAR